MTIPKINSAHGSDTRNIINRAIDLINAQGKSIQDLVAEGQLTPSQYAQLVSIVNGNVKKGSITTADIDKNNFKINDTMLADSLRSAIAGNAPIHATPPNNSLTTEKYVDDSVTKRKKTVGGETATLISWGVIPDINLTEKTITIYANTGIIYSKRRDEILTDSILDFVPGLTTSLIFDTSKKTFRTIASGAAVLLSEDEVYIAHLSFVTTSQTELLSVIGNFEYTVNGKNRIIKDSVHTDEIEDGAVSISKTDFIEVKNFYNKNDVVHGVTLDRNTGLESEHVDYNASGFIPMTANTDIYLKYILRVVYYDDQKNIISSYAPIPEAGKSHTTPANTSFIRLAVKNTLVEEAMVYLGTNNKDYEPFGFKILGADINSGTHSTNSPKFPPENIEAKFIAPDYNYETMTLEEYYTAFDVLVNKYPDNLKKKICGKDMSGQYDVIQYHYIPTSYTNENGQINRPKPKIVFISNIHGFEKPTSLATYYMIKSMLEDWRSNDNIEYLRSNVEMVFIPIANPYGYVNETYKNGNPNEPVNIQTNFPIHWIAHDPSSHSYGGTEPLSENEAKYIDDLLQEHSDALFFVDSHSAGSVSTRTFENMVYFMMPSKPEHYNVNVEESIKNSVEVISRELSKHYFPEYEGISGYYYLRVGNGTTEPYAASLGIPSFVSETFYSLPGDETEYQPTAIKAMTETFGNTLLTTLKTFKERM